MTSPLKLLQERAVQAARAAGAEMFLGLPDAWYEPHPSFGCANGHVLRIYIKSEIKAPYCPVCA